MGRNIEIGLKYFPLNVNFFSDLKVRKLIKYQGGKAITVYVHLLCYIYKEGYYIKWDNELPFIISESTGYDEAYIQEVFKCCLVVGLISKRLFEKEKVITSNGIQSRYQEICSLMKRKSVISEFDLINTEEMAIDSEEIIIDPELMQQKKRKERELKEREEKDADALIDSNEKNENKKNISSAPEITMPFGDEFSKLWGEWKDYKVREFKFHHKSPQSEQASLNELIKLGNGIEENCNKIIIQSMANTWKGFFELKDIKNGKTTNTGKQAVDVQSALDKLSRMS